MDIEALDFCYRASQITGPVQTALEFGARNLNGTARMFWEHATWTGIDLEPGDGVDYVADATDWELQSKLEPAQLVVSTEMLEHCERPDDALSNMAALSTEWVLVTCATTGRAPHSAHDGGNVRAGEHYENVTSLVHPKLQVVLAEVHEDRGDLYGLWRKRGNH